MLRAGAGRASRGPAQDRAGHPSDPAAPDARRSGARSSLVKILELPHTGRAQLGEMVAFELERHVPFPPEDIRFDFTLLPGDRQGAAACPRRGLGASHGRRGAADCSRSLGSSRRALTAACHDLPPPAPPPAGHAYAIWAHRVGGATDLVCLSQGRRRAEPHRAGQGRRRAGAARSPPRSGSSAGRTCDAVWISGDDAAEFLAAAGLSRARALRSPSHPWRPAVARAHRAASGGGSRAPPSWPSRVALGSNRPPLNLLPMELRPRTLSTGQLVTAGPATVTAVLGLSLLAGQGYQQHRYADRLSRAPSAPSTRRSRRWKRCRPTWPRRSGCSRPSGASRRPTCARLPILRELTERIPQDAWLRTFSMDKQGDRDQRPGERRQPAHPAAGELAVADSRGVHGAGDQGRATRSSSGSRRRGRVRPKPPEPAAEAAGAGAAGTSRRRTQGPPPARPGASIR